MRYVEMTLTKERVLNIVEESEVPLNIEVVRGRAGISWVTARGILLELVLEGKIAGLKTKNGWVFGIRKTLKPVQVDAYGGRER